MKPIQWMYVLGLAACSSVFGQTPPPDVPAPPPPQASPAPQPPQAPQPRRLFFGGSFGLGFGDVDWVEISPIVSYRVAPRFDLGGGVSYRYRNDKRYSPSFTANDWGANLFGRVRIYGPLFGQAEYDYDNYEFPTALGGTDRSTYNSFLIGAGVSKPLGRNAGVYAMVMYNLNYSSSDLSSPYSSPWVYRVGAGVSF